MEESERPTEFVEEQIHHQALHSKGDRTAWVAVTTAILAALAAVGSLLSNSRSNEAMMLQIQSSDQWSYYQEKGLKATLLASKIELLEVLNRPVPPIEKDKIQADLDKQAAAKTDAETKDGQRNTFLGNMKHSLGPSPDFKSASPFPPSRSSQNAGDSGSSG